MSDHGSVVRLVHNVLMGEHHIMSNAGIEQISDQPSMSIRLVESVSIVLQVYNYKLIAKTIVLTGWLLYSVATSTRADKLDKMDDSLISIPLATDLGSAKSPELLSSEGAPVPKSTSSRARSRKAKLNLDQPDHQDSPKQKKPRVIGPALPCLSKVPMDKGNEVNEGNKVSKRDSIGQVLL